MQHAAGSALPFAGGAVGYFSYDLVRQVEPIGLMPEDDLGLPDLMVMITGPVVVFDHLQHTLSVSVPCALSPASDPEPAYLAALATIAELKATLTGPLPAPSRGAAPRISARWLATRPGRPFMTRWSAAGTTSTPATHSRSFPRSGSPPRWISIRSRSTAGFVP